MAGGDERAHQIDAALELRRQRHDSDLRPGRFDDRQDVAARETASRLLASRILRQPETGHGLGPGVFGIDEVAFKVRAAGLVRSPASVQRGLTGPDREGALTHRAHMPPSSDRTP